MDIYDRRDFILHLKRLSGCLSCTRQMIVECLHEGGLIEDEDREEIASFCVKMDAFDNNKKINEHNKA